MKLGSWKKVLILDYPDVPYMQRGRERLDGTQKEEVAQWHSIADEHAWPQELEETKNVLPRPFRESAVLLILWLEILGLRNWEKTNVYRLKSPGLFVIAAPGRHWVPSWASSAYDEGSSEHTQHGPGPGCVQGYPATPWVISTYQMNKLKLGEELPGWLGRQLDQPYRTALPS